MQVYVRFPLLEPYYAFYGTSDNKIGWQIDLYEKAPQINFRYYDAIIDVRKIAVENGVIMVYTPFSKPIMLAGEELEKRNHYTGLFLSQVKLS